MMKVLPADWGKYVYPATLFVKSVSIKGQVEKIESEIFEVHQLLSKPTPNLFKIAQEVEDAILALETLRRMLQENHRVFVNKARSKTFTKVNKRGHFV